MQTFLPYADFQKTVKCLDWRRLGNQRIEARHILDIITTGHSRNGSTRWNNHPAVKMWVGYPMALACYMNCCIYEWIHRGYNNSMIISEVKHPIVYPYWLGKEEFHRSHRSNLLRKKPLWYSQFGWTEPDDLQYFWPKGQTHAVV